MGEKPGLLRYGKYKYRVRIIEKLEEQPQNLF